jgi:hypothetical protein
MLGREEYFIANMSLRTTTILTISIIVLAGIYFSVVQKPSQSRTTTNTIALTMPTRNVQLSDLSTGPLYYRENDVKAYDQMKQTTQVVVPDTTTQHIAFFSPTGQYAITVHGKTVALLRIADGKVLRTFQWEADRVLQNVAWSPEELTLVLTSDRQQPDGLVIAHSNQLDLWTVAFRKQLRTKDQPENEQPFSLLSVNTDGSQVLCGWTDEKGMTLGRYFIESDPEIINTATFDRGENFKLSTSLISAISQGRALVQSNNTVYEYNVYTKETKQLGKKTTSLVNISQIRPDGKVALIILGGTGDTNKVVTYSFDTGEMKTLLPVYSEQDGFYNSRWILQNQFLIYRTMEQQIFHAIDTQDVTGTLLNVAMPLTGTGWELLGVR